MEKRFFSVLKTILIPFFIFLSVDQIFPQTETKSVSTNTLTEQNPTYVKGMTPMRARALVGLALGLGSLITAWWSKRRAKAGIGNKGRNGAIVSLIFGAVAIILSAIHISITAGAIFGSGSGKAGAILALILGLAGVLFSTQVFRKKSS